MMKAVFFAALLGLLTLASADSDGDKNFLKEQQKLSCLIYQDLAFYDLRKLQSNIDYSYKGAFTNGAVYEFHWNFCQYVTEANKCGTESFATTFAAVGTVCQRLTSNDPKESDVKTILPTEKTESRHLEITYKNGPNCPAKPGVDYSFTVEVKCDNSDDASDTPTINSYDPSDPCNPKFVMTSKHGCPVFSATSWIRFLSKHPWILGTLLIGFGAVVTFYGRKFFPWTIALVGGGTGFLVAMLLFSLFGMMKTLDSDNKGSVALTVISFLLAIIVGVLVGFVLFKMLPIGAAVLGAVGGFFVGVTIYNLLFIATDSLALLAILAAAFSIFGAFLSFQFYDQIVIFGTSLIGSYAFIRGVSMFAGHFPSEVMLFQELSSGGRPNLPYQFYIYLTAIIVLFVLGSLFQLKQKKEEAYDDYKSA